MADDETFIPVHLILLGIGEDSETVAKSFVIVLRDEFQLQLK
jgi:hypothetical protein